MVVGIIVFDGWGLGLVIMGFVLFVSGYLVVYGEQGVMVGIVIIFVFFFGV